MYSSFLNVKRGAGMPAVYVNNNIGAVVVYNNIHMCTGVFFNVQRGASISAIYVNNDIDAFSVLSHKSLDSFRKKLLFCNNKLMSCIATSVFFIFCYSYFVITFYAFTTDFRLATS